MTRTRVGVVQFGGHSLEVVSRHGDVVSQPTAAPPLVLEPSQAAPYRVGAIRCVARPMVKKKAGALALATAGSCAARLGSALQCGNIKM